MRVQVWSGCMMAIALAMGGATPAEAIPITYQLAMTSTTNNINYTPIFGQADEFGGPFTGLLVVDYATLPGGTPNATITDFSMTIGTQSWDEDDVIQFTADVDATGAFTYLFFRANDNGLPDSADWDSVFSMFVNFGSDSSTFWRAFEDTCAVGADYVSGACIQGTGADVTQIVPGDVSTVPEPATLLMTGLGLIAIGRQARRRAAPAADR